MCDGVDNLSPALVYHGTPAPACVPHYKPGYRYKYQPFAKVHR